MATKRIRELVQTAEDSDLVPSSFFALDTENGTKRVPADLLLSGGDIEDAVNNWLASHPEATTNVPDNSLTDAKLHPSIKNNWSAGQDNMGRKILVSTLSFIEQINAASTIYEVRHHFDLDGETLNIPENVVLEFNGGSISNGTLNGSFTIAKSVSTKAFKGVTITGTWSNDEVSSSLFDADAYTNDTTMLRNLVKLGGGGLVIIENGEYEVEVTANNESVITIDVANTYLRNRGKLTLKPNGFTNYKIVNVVADNCTIDGGEFFGDVSTHTGTTGEWGHGIRIAANHIRIVNLTASHCWGDGIVVGYEDSDHLSQNVVVDNVKCEYCRRLGLSVTGAEWVDITNSEFNYNGTISGTLPKAGIDVEENEDSITDHVHIDNCTFIGNQAWGFSITKYPPRYPVSGREYSVTNCRVVAPEGGSKSCVVMISNNVLVDNLTCGILAFNKCNDSVIRNSNINEGVTFAEKNENIIFENCKISSTTRSFGYTGLVNVSSGAKIDGVTFSNCYMSTDYVDGVNSLSSVSGSPESVDIRLVNCYINASTRWTAWAFGDVVGCRINCNRIYIANTNHLKSARYIANDIFTSGSLIIVGSDVDNSKTITFEGNRFFSSSQNAVDLLDKGRYTANVVLNGNVCNKTNNQYVGTTDERPSNGVAVGQRYYDKTIGADIVWNGTDWVRDDGFAADFARIGSGSQYPTLATGNKFKRFPYFDYGKQRYAYWDGDHWRDANGFFVNKTKGTTAERPTNLGDSADNVGYMFYDKTLNKVIVWNGSDWTNVDGTALA